MEDAGDVIVIGGGVIGLSIAYFLSRRGREVTVIDRGPIGRGASHGNAGLLVPSHVVPLAAPGVVAQGVRWLFDRSSPFYIKPQMDIDLFRWLWRFWRSCSVQHVERSAPVLCDLSLRSLGLYKQLHHELSGFGFRQSGLLMLYRTEKGRQQLVEEAEHAQALGLPVRHLNPATLYEIEPEVPDGVEGALYFPQDSLLDPSAFIQVLRDHLEAREVLFCPEEAVEGFETADGSIVAVKTSRRVIRATEVVLAAGAWSGVLGKKLELALPIQPAKGYSLTYRHEGRGPRVPCLLTEAKVSITPLPGRIRFGGTLALAGFDPHVDEHRLEPIRQIASSYLEKGLDGEAEPWVGYRPCTPDGLPLVGRMEAYRNLVVAAGHAMIGMSLAPVTGELVAEIIEGGSPSLDISSLDPERFC